MPSFRLASLVCAYVSISNLYLCIKDNINLLILHLKRGCNREQVEPEHILSKAQGDKMNEIKYIGMYQQIKDKSNLFGHPGFL